MCPSRYEAIVISDVPSSNHDINAYETITSSPESPGSLKKVRLPFTIFKDLLRNHLANQSQILCEASIASCEASLYKWPRPYYRDGHHAHIC